MEQNVGTIDRVVRVILAVVCGYLGYTYHWAFYILTVMFVVTAATGFCWPYTLLGINTNKVEHKVEHKKKK